jgi:hypothetical protein
MRLYLLESNLRPSFAATLREKNSAGMEVAEEQWDFPCRQL